ncbi:MAG: hypothetical protein ACRC9X_05220 [Bacteroidales bacterium]
MKPLIYILLFAPLYLLAKPIENCQCNGKPLYGRIKFVEHHADFKVRIVQQHADLHVRQVKSHPTTCGLWQVVDHHPDFTVQIVEHHADFSIKYVEHHAGKP